MQGEAGFSVEGSKRFEFVEKYLLHSIQPMTGPVESRTVLTVIGSGFEEGGMRCRFGQEIVTGADVRVLSTTMLLCTAPTRDVSGHVSVEISSNERDEFRDGAALYTYEPSTHVTSIVPSKGLSGTKSQIVHVKGSHFSATTHHLHLFQYTK